MRFRAEIYPNSRFSDDYEANVDVFSWINKAIYLEKMSVYNQQLLPIFDGARTGFKIEDDPLNTSHHGFQLRIKKTDQMSVNAYNQALLNAGFAPVIGSTDGALSFNTIEVIPLKLENNGDAILRISYDFIRIIFLDSKKSGIVHHFWNAVIVVLF